MYPVAAFRREAIESFLTVRGERTVPVVDAVDTAGVGSVHRGGNRQLRIDIKTQMPLDFNQVEQPFKKLRKLLKNFPRQPSPKQVHDIRTRTRRVEAALSALSLDRKRTGKRLLKAITPVRKRAGKVRDMDVLTGFASTLSTDSDNQCRVQLLEHLGKRRFDGTRKLHKAVVRNRKLATRSLKSCSSSINKRLNGKKGRSDGASDASATALELSRQLANWPKLTASNLHPFRLKVKDLRNVLRLSGKDDPLVDSLGEVKDAIGEWHDWTELGNIANQLLDHLPGGELLAQIRTEAKRRFAKALEAANRLRKEYFEPRHSKNKRARSQPLKEPVLEASARLAA
jgi:CHAD domain-containing protein